MRVLVNLTRPGVRAVHFSPSDVFRMHGNEALTYDPEPDDGFRQEGHRDDHAGFHSHVVYRIALW